MGNAARKAREMAGADARVCVVGDTPRDFEAARANGLAAIAVATGKFSFDELLEAQAGSLRIVAGRFAGAHTGDAVKPHPMTNPAIMRWARFLTVSLLMMVFPGSLQAQAAGLHAQTQASPAIPAQSTTSEPASATDQTQDAQPAIPARSSDRRRAAKLYLASSKLFVEEKFEEAMHGYEQAAALDPGIADYRLAASVARSHAVTALIQAAAKARLRGDAAASARFAGPCARTGAKEHSGDPTPVRVG